MSKAVSAAALACLMTLGLSPSFAQGVQGAAVTNGPNRPVALVIGNASYPDAESSLKAPVNDARALADTLRDKGFDVVQGENLTKQGMHGTIDTFTAKVTEGSTVLLFFSGFGIQADRKTYLIPVNAEIWVENDVRRDGVSIEPILSELAIKKAGAKLVILDASRKNPFERRFRGFSGGLAGIYAPDDTLVISSTSPGKVANDAQGERGILIAELIAQMRNPDRTVEQIFNGTRAAVSGASNRTQVPWVSSSLVQDFVLGSRQSIQQKPGR